MRRRQLFAKRAVTETVVPLKLESPSVHMMEAKEFKATHVQKGVCPHCQKYIGRGVYTHWRGCRKTPIAREAVS
jgi:hypothetical protein